MKLIQKEYSNSRGGRKELSSEGIGIDLFTRCAARSLQVQKAYEGNTVLLRIFDKDSEEMNDGDELKEVIRSLGGAISDREYDVFIRNHANYGTRQLSYAGCLDLLRRAKLLVGSEAENITRSFVEDRDEQKPLAVVKLHRRTYQQHVKAVQEHAHWRKFGRPLTGTVDHEPGAFRLEDALDSGTVRHSEDAHVEAGWPRWAFAMWDYQGLAKTDLTFNRGDFIQILSEGDGTWWFGRLGADLRESGCVPSNHVSYMPVGFVPGSFTRSDRHSRSVASEEVNETTTNVQTSMRMSGFQQRMNESPYHELERDKQKAKEEHVGPMRVPDIFATSLNVPYVEEEREHSPYVNKLQFHRILKRRVARRELEKKLNDQPLSMPLPSHDSDEPLAEVIPESLDEESLDEICSVDSVTVPREVRLETTTQDSDSLSCQDQPPNQSRTGRFERSDSGLPGRPTFRRQHSEQIDRLLPISPSFEEQRDPQHYRQAIPPIESEGLPEGDRPDQHVQYMDMPQQHTTLELNFDETPNSDTNMILGRSDDPSGASFTDLDSVIVDSVDVLANFDFDNLLNASPKNDTVDGHNRLKGCSSFAHEWEQRDISEEAGEECQEEVAEAEEEECQEELAETEEEECQEEVAEAEEEECPEEVDETEEENCQKQVAVPDDIYTTEPALARESATIEIAAYMRPQTAGDGREQARDYEMQKVLLAPPMKKRLMNHQEDMPKARTEESFKSDTTTVDNVDVLASSDSDRSSHTMPMKGTYGHKSRRTVSVRHSLGLSTIDPGGGGSNNSSNAFRQVYYYFVTMSPVTNIHSVLLQLLSPTRARRLRNLALPLPRIHSLQSAMIVISTPQSRSRTYHHQALPSLKAADSKKEETPEAKEYNVRRGRRYFTRYGKCSGEWRSDTRACTLRRRMGTGGRHSHRSQRCSSGRHC